jgi:hypothetical protein
MSKVCTSCKKEKPFNNFSKSKLGKNGLASKCKKCVNELAVIRRKEKHIKNNTLSPTDRILQKIGTTYITNEGYKIEIIECFSYNNCTIKFENGLIINKVHFGSIEKGQVKNPYHPNNYGVGYIGIGKYKPVVDRKCTHGFNKWCNIIERGYSSLLKVKQPAYKDCTVDEHWHNFQNFAQWFEDNWKPHMEGWALDKDILVKGNKIYSPKTCCFVPSEINSIFVKNNINRGDCVIGVSKYKNKYRAFVNTNSTKIRYLGTFETELEAFEAYKTAKELWIKELADKWEDQIDPKVYKAMYDYKVEITD